MFNWLRTIRTRNLQASALPRRGDRHGLGFEQLEDRLQPSISLGAAAGFAVLGLENTQVVNSNVYINGDEGVSVGGTLKNMAPSTITGVAYESAANQYSGPGKLGGGTSISPSLLSQADADARSASAQAAALTPGSTFGSISVPTTITGNGGENVVKINGDIKSSLILNGTASDVFIINVTGTVNLSGSTTLGLAGGVTADHVLYNFIGTGGTIATHVGNVLNGTLLAPTYSFSLDGLFNGQIIGGGKSITLLSGARVNEVPFSPPTTNGVGVFGGTAYTDDNFDNVIDDGDSVLAGVAIYLYDSNGTLVAQTTTNQFGQYSFSGLTPGSYQIVEVSSNELLDNYVGSLGGFLSSDGVSSINVNAGDVGTNYDFLFAASQIN